MTADDLTRSRARRPGRADGPRPRWRTARRVAVGAVTVGYAWIAGGTKPLHTAALVSVLIAGAVLGGIACLRPPQRIPPPEQVDITGLSYWLIAIGVLFEWEASSFKDNSVWWHPALTGLINPLITLHPLRSAAIVIWLLAGWGLVRR
ncbi:MAG: hypothetical protein ACLQDY_28620 [Streptosporangiaceae bacterium]